MMRLAMSRGRVIPSSTYNPNHTIGGSHQERLLLASLDYNKVEGDNQEVGATALFSYPSDRDFQGMETSDPGKLASWIAHYQEQLKSSSKSCSELENELEMATKELQRLMFPVFLELFKTDILASSEVESFYHRHPFADVDQELKRIVWETSSFARSFLDVALTYLSDNNNNSRIDTGLLNIGFLLNHGQELWEDYGMGLFVQEHHAGWQETTAIRIQQAVDAVVGDRLDLAHSIYQSTTESGHPSFKEDMLPILDRLHCYAGRAQGASTTTKGKRVPYSFSTGQQAFVLTVTRKHLQNRFPRVMDDKMEEAKPLSFGNCFFVPVQDDFDDDDDDDEPEFSMEGDGLGTPYSFRLVHFGANDTRYYFAMKARLNNDIGIDKAETLMNILHFGKENQSESEELELHQVTPAASLPVTETEPRMLLRIVSPEKLQQPRGPSLASSSRSAKRSIFAGAASSSSMVAGHQAITAAEASFKRIKKDIGLPKLPRRKLAMRKLAPAERITFRW